MSYSERPAALLILALAVSSALLYSSLLPLWEGFDEAFHYAYVQSLSVDGRLPVLGRSRISAEVQRSLELAQVSHVLHRVFPETTTFDQWFALAEAERAARRQALGSLPPELRREAGPRSNYEAHQAPLAYLLLAPADALAGRIPLPGRILLLRIWGGVLSAAGMFFASLLLCRALGLDGGYKLAALACIFETQMLWATVAHVSNDWLAVPIATVLFALLVLTAKSGRARDACALAIALAAGLLTKAYFLAFVPLVAAVLLWKARRGAVALALCIAAAGPWYARNWVLYHNVSGTQEAFEGIGPAAALAAVPQIPWVETIGYMARAGLWTGNNSFTSFSRTTLNLELALIAVGIALYLCRWQRIGAGERWLAAAAAVFSLALGYAACTNWVHTRGGSAGASPWYSEVLLAPVLAVVFLGFQRARAGGRVLAAGLVLASAWVGAATYVAKLFPLYGGFPQAKAIVRNLATWWIQDSGNRARSLSGTCPAPPGILYVELVFLLVLIVVVTFFVLRRTMQSKV